MKIQIQLQGSFKHHVWESVKISGETVGHCHRLSFCLQTLRRGIVIVIVIVVIDVVTIAIIIIIVIIVMKPLICRKCQGSRDDLD